MHAGGAKQDLGKIAGNKIFFVNSGLHNCTKME